MSGTGTELPKVSVIVPAFNAESTLQRALDSVLEGDLKEVEVVVVDDHSTDGTWAMCERYAAADPRVTALQNFGPQGVPATRNVGLDAASGEYVAFLDSDDRVKPQMYAAMYRASSGVDFVECGFEWVFPYRRKVEMSTHPKGMVLGSDYLLEHVVAPMVGAKAGHGRVSSTSCNWIYRREVLRGNSVRFNESRSTHEDRLFKAEFLAHAETAVFLDEAFYEYILRSDSLSSRQGGDGPASMMANQVRYRELFGDRLDFETEEAAAYGMSALLNSAWYQMTHEPSRKRQREILRPLMTHPLVEEWLKMSKPTLRQPEQLVLKSAGWFGGSNARLLLVWLALRPRLARRAAGKVRRALRR